MPTVSQILEQGAAEHRQGNLAAAEASYRAVLAIEENNPDAWHLLGLIAHARGEHPVALRCIQKAIDLSPQMSEAHFNLAIAWGAVGELERAAESCRQAILLRGDFVQAHHSLGVVLCQLGKHDEGIASFRRALEISPDCVDAQVNLGATLLDRGDAREAAEWFRRALAINPRLADVHFKLGLIHQRQQQWTAAIEHYRAAIEIDADHLHAHSNLGTVYRAVHQLDDAVVCYQHVLELQPDSAEALANLANVFKLQGRVADAEICYEQALRLNIEHPTLRYNYGLRRLAAGDFVLGWSLHESRLDRGDLPQRHQSIPRWQGEPLAGRQLLVHAEQGLGDTIHFARYLKLLDHLDGSVSFEVQGVLMKLLQSSGFDGLLPQGAPRREFDLQVSLMSLPSVLGTTLDTVPCDVPYLFASSALVEMWRERLSVHTGHKVGIAWQGSTSYPDDCFRSIPLQQFAPLAMPGVELISLQKGAGHEQIATVDFAVTDLGEALDTESGPFMDTAAVMMNLDLVVTSDTAIAHLAGALGVPVWIALQIEPDWRWLRNRDDSPWYPTMRLFRQTELDQWPAVFEAMAMELRRRV